MEKFKPKIFFERKIIMAKLKTELTAIRNALQSLVDMDEDSDVIVLTDLVADLNKILYESKTGAFMVFDSVNESKCFVFANTKSINDSIHVMGTSPDYFDLELAFGIISRLRNTLTKDAMTKLFSEALEGDFSD